MLQAFTGLTREQVTVACWPVAPLDGRLDGASLRGFQEWAVARGLADRVLDGEEWGDQWFLDAARAR